MVSSVSRPEYWNTYWLSGGDAAYSQAGPLQPVLDRFWQATAARTATGAAITLLDIAAGAGAASRALLKHLGHNREVRPIACDLSWHAAKRAAEGPGAGIVADAGLLPFANGSIELTVSQYGLEYAGITALREAARVTRPQGLVALLMHHRQGALQAENERNFGAADAFLQSGVFPAFATLMRSTAQREFNQAEGQFAEAVRVCSDALHHWGRDAAGGSLLQVYRDLAVMHARIALQDPEEVARWCSVTEQELRAYADRMRHMLDAALGVGEATGYLHELEALGLHASLDELRASPAALPIAWTLLASKP